MIVCGEAEPRNQFATNCVVHVEEGLCDQIQSNPGHMIYTLSMNKKITLFLSTVLCLLSAQTFAADEQAKDDSPFTAEAPTAEELEGAEESPLELDPVEVVGESLDFRQEVALRVVRQAYGSPRSERHEDRDKWVCWLEKPTGTSFNYLGCARNGDIWALRPNSLNRDYRPARTAGYGKIMRTTKPVNRAKLERALAALPGSNEFDEEFLTMVMLGEQPPRDIPDDEELDQFAQAWVKIGKLQKRGKSETMQIEAIEKEGLTLKRYNRIAELTEIYQSVENQVHERVKSSR